MIFVRFLLIFSLVIVVVLASEATVDEAKGCSGRDKADACHRSNEPKLLSRKKRLVTLPNFTSMTMQSRLIVPQPPVGLYLVWVKARFFIRSMFTEPIPTG